MSARVTTNESVEWKLQPRMHAEELQFAAESQRGYTV